MELAPLGTVALKEQVCDEDPDKAWSKYQVQVGRLSGHQPKASYCGATPSTSSLLGPAKLPAVSSCTLSLPLAWYKATANQKNYAQVLV